MRHVRVLSLLLVVAAVAGCGGRKGDVSGTVRFKGEPLPAGRITFVCEGGDKPVLTADIQNGAYTIPGAPVGPVKIAVVTYEITTTPVPNMPGSVAPPGGATPAPPGKYVPIPSRYHNPDTSGLTYTVTGGSQTHDIKLEP